jgi:hypothetical protein
VISTALRRSAASAPYVSKAIVTSGSVAPLSSLKSRRVKSLLSTASRDEALAGTQVKIAATIAAINLIGGPSVDGLRRSTRCATESRAWAQRSWKVVQASALRKRMSAIPPRTKPLSR